MTNIRKALCIAIIALLFALVAYIEATETQIAFEFVLNNTNKYPVERLHNITYYTNNSAIEVFLIFHVIGTGAQLNVDTNVSINNTVVLDKDYRTNAGAGIHEHFSYSFIVPKNSNYSVTNSTNIETIEWREYPILSGRNGTLSINQTIISGTTLDNASVLINESQVVNLSADLNSKVNKSGDNMTGDLNVDLKNVSANSFQHLDDAPAFSGLTSDWHYFTQSQTNTNAMVMMTASSNFTYSTNFFGGIRARGNLTNPTAIQKNDVMFYFYGIGHDGTQYKSSNTNPNVVFKAEEAWNATSNPTKITMSVTDINSVSTVERFNLTGDGSLTLSKLAGVGNAYVCVDQYGKLYRGNPGC